MAVQHGEGAFAGRNAYTGPLYSQLTARLRDRIRSEDWRAGTLIPSESDLAREYGVSVGTARKALEGLENDGWIIRKQGRGTFVTDLARQQMERLCRLRTNSDGSGFEGCVVSMVSNQKGPATAREAQALGLKAIGGVYPDVVRMMRHYFRDEAASVLEQAVFPAALFPGMEEITRVPLNLFTILVDEYSVVPHRAAETVSAELADVETAQRLKIRPGVPLLCSQAVVIDVDGRKVLLVHRAAHAKGMRYEVELN